MTININQLNNSNAINVASQSIQSLKQSNLDFSKVFDQAMLSSAATSTEFSNPLKKAHKNKTHIDAKEYFEKSESILLAQLQGDNTLTPGIESESTVPIQVVFNRLIENLAEVSDQEFRVNTLIEGFIRGEVSEDEVVLETAKLNLMMSMITTLVQTGVQTFKEILQIPV